jgi:cytochrome c-type biogenesis protein CcmH
MKAIFTIVVILFFPLAALAVDPGEILKDPNLEKRARSISKGLRCVVCQNQSIDDSDAQLARDLRILVRNRIVAGDSDTAVIDYVVSRYGDFVLLEPPVKGVTLVLWFGPIFMTLAGLIGLILFFRRQRINSKDLAQMDNKEINN